jgi:hypothetical protein
MCIVSAYSEREAKRIHSSFRASSSSGKRENSQNSLLDTFSLSWSGNFDFSRSFSGIQKIFEGIFTFIDLKAIRATIEAAFRFLSSPSTEIKLLQRSDQDVEDLEHYNTEDVQAEKDRKELRKEGMISGLTTFLFV